MKTELSKEILASIFIEVFGANADPEFVIFEYFLKEIEENTGNKISEEDEQYIFENFDPILLGLCLDWGN